MDSPGQTGHDAPPPASRRLPRLLKEKTSEKVYPKTLLITALTAITLAAISARLTGLVNSLVLVAFASVGTAIVSEFYRVTLEGTRKAIALAVSKTVDRRLGELTGEAPVVAPAPPVPPTTSEVREEEVAASRPVTWLFFHRLFVSRWAVPIVFTLVALATVMGSYFVGKVQAAPQFNVVREITQTRDISDSQAEEIQQEAKLAAAREAAAAGKEAEAEAEETAETMVNATRSDLLLRIEALEEALAAAEESNETDAALITELVTTITALEQEIARLENRMERVENRNEAPAEEEPEPEPESQSEPPPAEGNGARNSQ